jgi:dTDP-glucose 4,6-dehydratase
LARAWYETYQLPVITTNCSNNYGPRQFPEKLIPYMITRAISGQTLPIYGNGKNIRDWIHVEDHCFGVYQAMVKGKIGNTYCFGGNAEQTNIELVTTLCGIMDELCPAKYQYNSKIEFVRDREGHDFRYAIDDSKAVRELDFGRQYSLYAGLKSTVKWYLANIEWCQKVTKNTYKVLI